MTARINAMADWRDQVRDTQVAAERDLVPTVVHCEKVSHPVSTPDAVEIDTLRLINARLMREIADLRQREATALRLADRDGLTGLYNRRRLSELLREGIEDAARRSHRLGVLFIDLDGFKRINDEFGHARGDELLSTIAGRIATRARTGDVVCRYGGDEFVVLLPRVPDRAAALEVAQVIAERVGFPCMLGNQELHVTAAIGISVYPEDGSSVGALLERADQEMYRVKGAAPDDPSPAPCRRRNDRPRPG